MFKEKSELSEIASHEEVFIQAMNTKLKMDVGQTLDSNSCSLIKRIVQLNTFFRLGFTHGLLFPSRSQFPKEFKMELAFTVFSTRNNNSCS